MGPILNLMCNSILRPVEAVGTKELINLQLSEEEEKDRLLRPETDIYIPEEQQEPSGRYWIESGEDGTP